MRGYVAKRRNRFWPSSTEGSTPITGRERRSWHPPGTDRGQAEQLAARLAAAVTVAADRQGRAWAATSPGGGCQPSS